MVQTTTTTAAQMETFLDHTAWIRDVARKLVRDPHLADDLVQETCLAALRTGPGTQRSLRAWLGTVLRNVLWERVRGDRHRAQRERRVARVEAQPSTLDLVERVSLHQRVADEVGELEEPYRSTLFLRYLEEKTPTEIARELSVPVSTVKTRLARGLTQLRERLDRIHGGDGRSWYLALVPLVRDPIPPAPVAPVAPVATGSAGAFLALKLVALVVVLASAGYLVAWPDRRPAEPPALAARPSAAPGASNTAFASADSPPQTARESAPRADVAVPATGVLDLGDPLEFRNAPVRGRVLDAEGGPASGVLVHFEPDRKGDAATPIAISGPDGSFVLNEARGTGLVMASGEEFVTLFAGEVTKTRSARPVLVVAPRSSTAGRVIDERGRPIEGAWVGVRFPADVLSRFGANMNHSTDVQAIVQTGADGRFELADAPRVRGAEIRVEREGFEPLTMPQPDATARLDLALRRSSLVEGRVLGTIVDSNGRAVSDARVSYGLDATRTDELGRFGLDPAGGDAEGWDGVVLVAMKSGMGPAALEVPIDAKTGVPTWPEPLVLELGEAPLTISGRVVDPSGAGVAGVLVWTTDATLFARGKMNREQGNVELSGRLQNGKGPRESLETVENFLAGDVEDSYQVARTDEEGRFELGGLMDREYTLGAIDKVSLVRVDSKGIPAGSEDVVITLDGGNVWKTVRGRVVSRAGEPVADVAIELRNDAFQARFKEYVVSTNLLVRRDARATAGDGSFLLTNVPRQGAYLRITGAHVVPTDIGRSGLDFGSSERAEDVELLVPLRVDFRVELAGTRADSLAVLDDRDRPLELSVIKVGKRQTALRAPIQNGRSPVLSASDAAATLVLYAGEEELDRLPVRFQSGAVNEIRP